MPSKVSKELAKWRERGERFQAEEGASCLETARRKGGCVFR